MLQNLHLTSVQIVVLVISAILVVAYLWFAYKTRKKQQQLQADDGLPPRKKKNNSLYVGIALVVLVLGGYLIYQNYIKDKDYPQIALSEAITLSKENAFNELVIQNKSNSTILEFTVSKNIEVVQDVNGKDVKIIEGEKIQVDAGIIGLKDLTDMGLVLPDKYHNEEKSSADMFRWGNYLIDALFLGALLWYYLGVGRGGAEKFVKDKSSITFKDIGGLGEAKDSLKELVYFLSNKKYFDSLGAKIPRGVLLEGAPGCGKTLIARAIANEANVDFYYTSGSELQDKFVGVAALKVKNIFKKARKTRSVLFIDEIDSVAERRSLGNGDAGREWNHVVNQLLTEMDGFQKDEQVIVIAATNRVDALDPAILRSGRFDRKITIPLPSFKDRCEIISIHAKDKPLAQDVNVESIAKQTSGFSGADLALLLNEAAIIAGREKSLQIEQKHIIKAVDKVLAGDERKNLNVSVEDRKLIAYHEAGHALVAQKLPDADKVQRISILPRGQAGGFTRTNDDKEHLVISKSKILAMITMLLGGRASEEIALNAITSGAQSDLQKANQLAREMVEHFGMSDQFGLGYASVNQFGLKEVSPETQKMIDEDIARVLKECYANAKQILTDNQNLLDKLANRLLEVESVDAEEVQNICKE